MIREDIQLSEREAVMETKNRSFARRTFGAMLPTMALVMLMTTAGYAAANSTTSGDSLAEALWGAPITYLGEPPKCPGGTDGWGYGCAVGNRLQRPVHGSSTDNIWRHAGIKIPLGGSVALDKKRLTYTSPEILGVSSAVVVIEPRVRVFHLRVKVMLQYSF